MGSKKMMMKVEDSIDRKVLRNGLMLLFLGLFGVELSLTGF